MPGRAIVSVVFSCFSLYMLRVYGQVHWLPSRFMKDGQEVFHRMLSQVGPIRDQLDIGCKALAIAAVIWCIWSWRTEHRMAAIIATAFAAFAVICAVLIVM